MGIIKTIVVGGKDLTEKQEKIRKLFMYLVSGGITTVVNWVCYVIFDKTVKASMPITVFGKEISLKFVMEVVSCGINFTNVLLLKIIILYLGHIEY